MVRVKPSSSTSATASRTWATSSLTTPNRSHHSTTATGCSTSSTTPTRTSWRTSGRDDSTSPCRSARGSTATPEEVLGDDWRSNTSLQIRDGFMPGSQYPANSPFISISTLGKIDFSQYEGTENYEEEAGNYKIREQITAGYLRFDQKIGRKLSATLGLRVERTDLKTSGYNVDIPEDGDPTMKPTGDIKSHYTDLLPSLLLKYKHSDDGSLRASITKTISRPKYSALIANKTFNIADEEATIGDPNTKPARALNIDLSADHYFKSVGLVSLGLFYKDIKNVNVEWASNKYLGSDLGLSGDNADKQFAVTQNINAYDARVYGVEVAYQRDFGFITPALKCLGFYGNYTYTHSTTRNFNERLGIEDGDDVKVAGSPEHTANASLFFEKCGLSLRLSYNFASSRPQRQLHLGKETEVYSLRQRQQPAQPAFALLSG